MADEAAVNEWLRERGLPNLDQLERMQKEGRRVQGHIARGLDGQGSIVPAAQSIEDETGRKRFVVKAQGPLLPEAAPDPVPRAAQARIASLVEKIVAQYKATGRLELNDKSIQAIQVESLKLGNPLSGEDIRRIAIHFLEEGERTNAEGRRTMKLKEITKKLKEGGDNT